MKPFIREFIINGFLNGTSKASSDDALGITIKPWLIKPPSNIVRVYNQNDINNFTFELPFYHDKNVSSNWYVSPNGQAYIESIFDIMMKRNMYSYIDNLVERHNFQIKDCIIDWCYAFNVTFEYINYEALKKSYYRYRKNNKILVENCPAIVPYLSRTCPIKKLVLENKI